MIGHFPKVTANSLFHWGTMRVENINKSGFSQEGNNLSLSECPNDWSKILRLGQESKLFSFSKTGGIFVDILSVLKDNINNELREELLSLAITNGLLERKEIYKFEYEDPETEDIMQMFFETREQALKEAYDECEVFCELSYIGTKKLRDSLGVSEELSRIRGEEYAYIDLIKKYTNVDGIFWNYQNDVNIYSLPLYCIFPHKVSEWSYKEVK